MTNRFGKFVYVIMVEHKPTNQTYVSGEGYDDLQKAKDFLVNERSCKLYDKPDDTIESKDGWYGKPTNGDEHTYYIRQIQIK